VVLVPLVPKLALIFNKTNTNMDRHHLLALLDKIQEKYDIQDGDYKEFIEAIGGKKSPINIKEGDLVKISYDYIDSEVDFNEEEFFPKLHVTRKCSRIWKIAANVNAYHGGTWISYSYMYNSEMHLGAVKKIAKDYSDGNFTMISYDPDAGSKCCLRVYKIEVI